MEAIEAFGFYLATIDMRQEFSINEACVAELLASARIVEDYSSLIRRGKMSCPTKTTRNRSTYLGNLCSKIRAIREGIGYFSTARELKDKLGEEVIKQHIISHSESVSDLLELAVLLKEVGFG